MTEYDYKNFKIHYNICSDKSKKNLYIADGYISNPSEHTDSASAKRFHTEYTTKTGVQSEIKKLIENYIDFEWKEFYEMHGKVARE